MEPVGGTTRIKVDVRVLAATNKDLPAEIRGRPVPRGSVLPAERHPDLRAAAARARTRTSRCSPITSWPSSRASTAAGRRRSTPARVAGAAALRVARQRPRAAQRDRAADDHGARRRDLAGATSAFLDPATRRRSAAPTPAAPTADAARGARAVRARLHPAHARRAAGQHVADRGSARRRAQQPVPEDAGVRDRAGPPGRGATRSAAVSSPALSRSLFSRHLIGPEPLELQIELRRLTSSAAAGTSPTISLSSTDTPYRAASRLTSSNTRKIGVFS